MHSYLRAIGFSKIDTRAKEWALIDSLIKTADETVSFKADEGARMVIYKKHIAPGCGVTLVGAQTDDEFRLDYYFPYMETELVTSCDACEVTRKGGQEDYLVSSEDSRFGVTTIFHLTNPEDFFAKKLKLDETYPVRRSCMTGLAAAARILLPVVKTEDQIQEQKLRNRKRTRLLQEARSGDEDAMEELTNQEMETISVVNQRIFQDDLYSVIDSFFMPYGVECDQYMLLGEILHVEKLVNALTKECFYRILVRANDIEVTVGVLAADLVGAPETGRRIKCQVWLQGTVDFLS